MTDIAIATGLIVTSGAASAFALVRAAFAVGPARHDPTQVGICLREAFADEDALPAEMVGLLDRLN